MLLSIIEKPKNVGDEEIKRKTNRVALISRDLTGVIITDKILEEFNIEYVSYFLEPIISIYRESILMLRWS